jgi:lysozyme family protein
MTPFDRAVGFVLDVEGGHVADSHDPGGETKYGISQRAYPHLHIGSLTEGQARALYRRDYWERAGCGSLPPPIAIALFDAAVNQGPARAIRLLQRSVRVTPDGIIGPVTRAAIAATEPRDLLLDFLSHRLRAYAATRNAARFMRGWSRRVLALHALLLSESAHP